MTSAAPVFRLAQLPVSLSRTSVRHGHIQPRRKTPKPELSNFAPGHGEQIWVWNNLVSHQIVYSHTKHMDSNRAMRQLPFIAKKSKPAKLRKDLWKPMALIQFPAGTGVAGQSAFQKLREYRRRHELEWGDEKTFKEDVDEHTGEVTRTVRSKRERGFAIHDQRANAVADMAAVLAGAGRGSRLWLSPEEKKLVEEGGELRGKKWSSIEAGKAKGKSGNDDASSRALVEAKVFWADIMDTNYAAEWSDNVTHEVFEESKGLQSESLEEPFAEKEKKSTVIQGELLSG